MRLYRNAIILVVVLGLLVGAYVFINNRDENTDSSKSADIIKILDFDKDKVTEMTLENKDGKFVFARKDKDWVATSPADLKINSSAVDSIAINASSLVAEKLIEDNASDLAQYGLAQPSATVTFKLEDGSVKVIEVGDATPTGGAYYLKEKDNNKVYTIGSYTGEKLLSSKNDLKDKTLFFVKPEDVIGFTMEKGGGLVFSAKKLEAESWNLTSPIQGNADTAKLGPIIESVVASEVSNFEDENPSDLDKYGLKNPQYSLEVETANSKTKILIGYEKVKGSELYAKLSDSNEVFTLSETSLNFIDKPLKEIIEVFAYIVNIQDVNKIEVEMDGKTVNCDIQTDKDDKDKDKFVVDGIDVSNVKDDKDSQLFRKYYQALIGVTMSEVEPGATPSGNAEITFTYSLKKDPGTMKVEFIPKNDNYYYVKRNGVYTGILVAKSKFDEPEGVRDTYKKLVEGMNKK